MSRPAPRLLVTLRPRESVTDAIDGALGQVPWTYAEGSAPAEWGSVEAMLIGALERELGSYASTETPSLRFVQRIYTGIDDVPFDRFRESVRIAGNVGAYAPFVAEHAVALALAAARDLVRADRQVREGRLRPAPSQRVLFGRTAVILGYGEIGRAIARRLQGFEMRIVGVNRDGRMSADADAMYPAAETARAVADGEFVFDARPLTRSTRGSVDAGILSAMRPDAVYVNVGRAGTVDESALYAHLRSHPDFRAALDVWWEEDFVGGNTRAAHPFHELENLVGSPHSAGFGPGVEEYVLAKALENLGRYFRGEDPLHVADRADYVR